jgi:hypothetical protein
MSTMAVFCTARWNGLLFFGLTERGKEKRYAAFCQYLLFNRSKEPTQNSQGPRPCAGIKGTNDG